MATSTSDMPLIIVLAQRVGLVDEQEAGELGALAKAHPRATAAAFYEAVRLREAIYALFLSEDAGHPYPDEAFEVVHDIAGRARARESLSKTEDGFRWRLPLTDLTDLVGLFAMAATDLLVGRGDRRLIRECKGDNCGWLFLYTSRSGRRLGVPRRLVARTNASKGFGTSKNKVDALFSVGKVSLERVRTGDHALYPTCKLKLLR